jgi:hypothetical protein
MITIGIGVTCEKNLGHASKRQATENIVTRELP